MEINDPTELIFADLRSVNEEQKEFISSLKNKANDILLLLEKLPSSRRKSIAITKLEECILFANKCACLGK